MWANNLVFYKSKSYLIIVCTNICVHKKPSLRLSTNLYNQVHVYFNHRDMFNLSKG